MLLKMILTLGRSLQVRNEQRLSSDAVFEFVLQFSCGQQLVVV